MPLRELPALTPVPARQITSGCLSGPLSGQSQIKLLEKFLYRNAVMPGNALQMLDRVLARIGLCNGITS